jgi:homoprotocatechuate degradation regulator HpaR
MQPRQARAKPIDSKVPLRDFSRSLPMSLLRAREAVMQPFRAMLREHDITEQQWRVLRALTTQTETSISALAESTFLLGPSLSRILRDLEDRKLIHRTTTESDLRRTMIGITPTGKHLVDTVAPHSEAIYADITDRFGSEKLALLQSLLAEIETDLKGTPHNGL